MDVTERAAAGKAARSGARRSSHGEWEPAAARRDPLETLQEQAESRVQELVPIRYGRMAVSPFTFYRGAAAVMAADLAPTPTSGFEVQACGDAHLTNFGAFAAPDRTLVFDLNDFDETLPGPWEWDLKRLAASLEIAGRQNEFGRVRRRTTVLATVAGYREAMARYAGMRTLEIWYSRLGIDDVLERLRVEDPDSIGRFQKAAAKARGKDSLRALDRLAERDGEKLRIVSDPPLLVPVEELLEGQPREELESVLMQVIDSYRSSLPGDRRGLLDSYRTRHLARKVVGVGSVGTRAWIVLMTGRDDDDPLFLQAKEAQASVLEPYVGASRFDNHGQRVVEGQRLMQAASDIFLGWCPARGIDGLERDFYVRQLWDWKRSVDPELLSPKQLALYGGLCGQTLARAHARSGDAIAIATYLGSGDTFDRAIAEFSTAYADQNEKDHAALLAAIAEGSIPAEDA